METGTLAVMAAAAFASSVCSVVVVVVVAVSGEVHLTALDDDDTNKRFSGCESVFGREGEKEHHESTGERGVCHQSAGTCLFARVS